MDKSKIEQAKEVLGDILISIRNHHKDLMLQNQLAPEYRRSIDRIDALTISLQVLSEYQRLRDRLENNHGVVLKTALCAEDVKKFYEYIASVWFGKEKLQAQLEEMGKVKLEKLSLKDGDIVLVHPNDLEMFHGIQGNVKAWIVTKTDEAELEIQNIQTKEMTAKDKEIAELKKKLTEAEVFLGKKKIDIIAERDKLKQVISELPSKKEIEKIVLSKHIYTDGVKDDDVFVTIPFKELAQVIHSRIRKE